MINKPLYNKKVLFIGYEYFDYHLKIKKGLTDLGAVVYYYPVMNYNLKFTILRRINKKLFINHNNKHAKKILAKSKTEKYDFVFVIDGKQLPNFFYMKLRLQNPKSKFINYHWDSVKKNEFGNSILDITDFFDKVYSFDLEDCLNNKKLNYLPLFFSKRNNKIPLKKKYDISFVGSITTLRRYKNIKKIEKYCKENNLIFKYYMLIPVRDYIRFFLKGYWLKSVNFTPLEYDEVQNIYGSSKAVIDIPNQVQSGLTMRIIEVLADKIKLITTNHNIKKETIFNKNNICFIDLENIDIDKSFLDRKFIDINIEKYSLKSWLFKLFNNEE